jgi:hypothetical protein
MSTEEDGPPRLPAREAFTTPGLGEWLDTGAGQAFIQLQHHGSRDAARAALNAQEEAAHTWRQERAGEMYARNPERYPGGMAEALARVPDPPAGTFWSGSSQDAEQMSAWTDPTGDGFRVIAPERKDVTIRVGTFMDGNGNVIHDPSLVAPPWRRE